MSVNFEVTSGVSQPVTPEVVISPTALETQEKISFDCSKELSLFSRILDCTGDFLSYVRNSLTAVEILRNGGSFLRFTAPLSRPILAFGALNGGLLTVSGAIGVGRSCLHAKSAWDSGDQEGAALDACFNIPIASSVTVIGGSMLGLNVASLQGAAGAANVAGLALSISAFAMPIFLGLYSGYGLWAAEAFKGELDEQLQSGDFEEGLKNTLAFLLEKTTLSKQEKEQCGGDLEKENALLQTKHAWLIRRTSDRSLQKLLDADLQSILSDWDKQKAVELITAVYEENDKTKMRFAWLGVVSLSSFAISLICTFCTGGLGSLLFAVGAVFWMSVDSPKFRKKMENFVLDYRKEFAFPSFLNKAERSLEDQKKFWTFVGLAVVLAPLWVIPTAAYLESASMVRKLKRSQMYAEASEFFARIEFTNWPLADCSNFESP